MQSRCKYCQNDIVVDVRITRANQRRGVCRECGREYFIIANDQGQPVRLTFEEDGQGLYERTCTRCGNLFRTDSLRDIPVCNNCKTGEFIIDTATDQWSLRQRDVRTPDLVIDNTRPPMKPPVKVPKETTLKPRKNMRRKLGQVFRFLKWTVIALFLLTTGFVVWRNLPKQAFDLSKSANLLKARDAALRAAHDPAFEEQQTLNEIKDEVAILTGTAPAAAPEPRSIEALLDKDQPLSYTSAALAAKRSLLAHRRLDVAGDRFNEADVLSLGYLAEATAYMVRHHRQEELERRALLVSDIALRLQPNSPIALRGRAAALLFAGDKSLAKQLLENIPTSTLKLTPRLLMYRAIAGLEGELPPIINDLIALQGEAPQLLELSTVLSDAYIRHNELAKARKVAEGRLKLDGGAPVTFYQLGIIAARDNDFKTAISHLQRALKLTPTFIDARLRLAALYFTQQKQPDFAERHLRDLLGRYLSYTDESQRKLTYFYLGNIELQRKKYAASLEAYAAALKISPYFVAALMQRGAAYEKVDNEAAALQDYQLAVQVAANRPATVLPLARLLTKQKSYSEALRLLNDAAAAQPDSLLFLMEQVHVYMVQQLFGEAERLIQHAISEVKLIDERHTFGLGVAFGLPIAPQTPDLEEGVLFNEWALYQKDLTTLREKQADSSAVETFIGNLQAAGFLKKIAAVK